MHRKARQETTSDPDLLSTPTKTSIPTSTSPATDPAFDFNPISAVTACEICNITWLVSNPDFVNLTSVGINLEAAGIGDNFTLSDITIAANVPVLSHHFTWNPVNVRPGSYEIFGRWSDKHGAAVKSQVFDVKTGNTTACLTNSTDTSAPPKSTSHSGADSGTVLAIIVECIIVSILLAALAAIVIGPLRDFYRRRLRRRSGDGPNSRDSASSASRDVGVGTHQAAHPSGDSDDRLVNNTNNVAPAFVQLTPLMTRIPSHKHNPLDIEPSASRDVLSSTDDPASPSTDSVYDYLGHSTNNVASVSPQLTRLRPHTSPYNGVATVSIPSSKLSIK